MSGVEKVMGLCENDKQLIIYHKCSKSCDILFDTRIIGISNLTWYQNRRSTLSPMSKCAVPQQNLKEKKIKKIKERKKIHLSIVH